jgi:hypothetical protein
MAVLAMWRALVIVRQAILLCCQYLDKKLIVKYDSYRDQQEFFESHAP